MALVSTGLALLLVPLIEGPGKAGRPGPLVTGRGGGGIACDVPSSARAAAHGWRIALVDMRLLAQRRFALGALLCCWSIPRPARSSCASPCWCRPDWASTPSSRAASSRHAAWASSGIAGCAAAVARWEPAPSSRVRWSMRFPSGC
ncbi:hypothetical protein M8494_23130 [Serratia ureilytica]